MLEGTYIALAAQTFKRFLASENLTFDSSGANGWLRYTSSFRRGSLLSATVDRSLGKCAAKKKTSPNSRLYIILPCRPPDTVTTILLIVRITLASMPAKFFGACDYTVVTVPVRARPTNDTGPTEVMQCRCLATI